MYQNEMPTSSNWQPQGNYIPFDTQLPRDLREKKASVAATNLLYPDTSNKWSPPRALSPPPQYVKATPVSNLEDLPVNLHCFCNPEHSKLFKKAREDWRKMWDLEQEGSAVEPGSGSEDQQKGHQDITSSDRPPTFASGATGRAAYPNYRDAAVFKTEITNRASGNDRKMLLEYLQRTIDEALPAAEVTEKPLEAHSRVEVHHPKPCAFPILHPSVDHRSIDPSRYLGSEYLTRAGAQSIWKWMSDDDLIKQKIERALRVRDI